ncbi:MAG: hypothetical protein WBQ44_05205 [Rhodococcus sp. (in: high G+C Gram-positive bacteria)]
MSPTLWLLSIAAVVYLVGRRRSRRKLIVCAQLIGAGAICLVIGQVLWAIVRQ